MTTMIALAMFALTASAQFDGNRPPKPTPEQTTERMAEQLTLTDAQKAQVLTLNTEYQDFIGGPGMGGPRMGGPNGGQRPGGHRPDGASGATAPNNGQPPQRPELTEEQKAKFEEMRTKREEYNTKLKAILTDDQYAKYEESQKRGPRGGFGQHGDNAKKDKKK